MADSLFTPDQDDIVIDDKKNYLEELVGDDKKFKTPEDLAKGKYHADQTIESMKRRLDQSTEDYKRVREENVSRAKLEEYIDRISKGQPSNNDNQNTPGNQNTQPEMDFSKVEQIVSERIKQEKAAEVAQNNLSTVERKLKERFGDSFSTVLKRQTEELGLTPEEATALARRSPAAFFRTFGVDRPANTETFQ